MESCQIQPRAFLPGQTCLLTTYAPSGCTGSASIGVGQDYLHVTCVGILQGRSAARITAQANSEDGIWACTFTDHPRSSGNRQIGLGTYQVNMLKLANTERLLPCRPDSRHLSHFDLAHVTSTSHQPSSQSTNQPLQAHCLL